MPQNKRTVFCHGTRVCHRRLHVLLYEIVNQHMTETRLSCRRVVGKLHEQDIWKSPLFPGTNVIAETPSNGLGTRPPLPWIPQDSLLEEGSQMALYATICGVVETLREPGIWRPFHSFSKFVSWGSDPRPFRRQTPRRQQFPNHGRFKNDEHYENSQQMRRTIFLLFAGTR